LALKYVLHKFSLLHSILAMLRKGSPPKKSTGALVDEIVNMGGPGNPIGYIPHASELQDDQQPDVAKHFLELGYLSVLDLETAIMLLQKEITELIAKSKGDKLVSRRCRERMQSYRDAITMIRGMPLSALKFQLFNKETELLAALEDEDIPNIEAARIKRNLCLAKLQELKDNDLEFCTETKWLNQTVKSMTDIIKYWNQTKFLSEAILAVDRKNVEKAKLAKANELLKAAKDGKKAGAAVATPSPAAKRGTARKGDAMTAVLEVCALEIRGLTTKFNGLFSRVSAVEYSLDDYHDGMHRGKSFEAQGQHNQRGTHRLVTVGAEELSASVGSLSLDRDMTEGFSSAYRSISLDRFEPSALDPLVAYLPHCLAWKPDGAELVYSIADTGMLTIVSPRSKYPLYTIVAFETVIKCVAWSPSPQRKPHRFKGTEPYLLAIGGKSGKVIIYRPRKAVSDDSAQILDGHSGVINAICWSPFMGGFEPGAIFAWWYYLASASSDGSICLWSIPFQPLFHQIKQEAVMRGHSASVNTLSWSLDGLLLASGADDGDVRIWDLSELGKAYALQRGHSVDLSKVSSQVLKGHIGKVHCVCWGNKRERDNSWYLASGSADGSIIVWLVNYREVASKSTIPHYFRTIKSGWWHRILVKVNPQMGEVLTVSWGTLRSRQQLITSGACRRIQIWSILSHKQKNSYIIEEASLIDHNGLQLSEPVGIVSCVAWSPDNTQIASISRDGTIRLWATQFPELPTNAIYISTFRDIIKYGHIDDFVHGLKAIDDALGKKVPTPARFIDCM
jgi:WD40 repeat protein